MRIKNVRTRAEGMKQRIVGNIRWDGGSKRPPGMGRRKKRWEGRKEEEAALATLAQSTRAK